MVVDLCQLIVVNQKSINKTLRLLKEWWLFTNDMSSASYSKLIMLKKWGRPKPPYVAESSLFWEPNWFFSNSHSTSVQWNDTIKLWIKIIMRVNWYIECATTTSNYYDSWRQNWGLRNLAVFLLYKFLWRLWSNLSKAYL